jgi:hypothetical protein
MEMSQFEKMVENRKRNSQIKYHIGKFGTLLTREVGFECEYNIVVLDWHFTDVNPFNKTASLTANYFFVYKYTTHGLEDRMHLLKDKGDSPNKHSVDTAFTNYNDVVIATLRSRGLSTYTTGTNPIYEVTGTTSVKLDFGGVYSGASMSPYAQFGISGVTNDGSSFNFKVSLDSTDSNYISKVFGFSNFGKPSNEVPLFVEEQFTNFLNYSYKKGYIRGIKSSVTALPSAQDDNSLNRSIGWYLEQYQTPETPYLVSELKIGRASCRERV